MEPVEKSISTEADMAKILLIDDDPLISQMISSVLNASGHSTSIAGSGKAGFEMLLQEKPDCVILDHILPDILGIQVLESIRENDEVKDTPVIFYTGYNDLEIKKEATRLGVVKYLLKFEIKIQTLPTIIQEVLKK
ncbi:MAG: response regulator [Candidatus Levybacteria bacterium]|nr:response regulator [Candidatus Levybacteria bacterium]